MARSPVLAGVEPVVASEDDVSPVVRCRLRADSTSTEIGSGSPCSFGVEGHRFKHDAERTQVFNIDSVHTCPEAARDARMYSYLSGVGTRTHDTRELLESLESEMARQEKVAAEAKTAAAAAAGTEAGRAGGPVRSPKGKERAEPEAGPSGTRNGDAPARGTSPAAIVERAQSEAGGDDDNFQYASPLGGEPAPRDDSERESPPLSPRAAGKKREARAPSPTGREKRLKPERLIAREKVAEEAPDGAPEQPEEASPALQADVAPEEEDGAPAGNEPAHAQPDQPLAPAAGAGEAAPPLPTPLPMIEDPLDYASEEEWEAYDPKAWLDAAENNPPSPELPRLALSPERAGTNRGDDVHRDFQHLDSGIGTLLVDSRPDVQPPPPSPQRLVVLPAASPKLRGFFAALSFEPSQQETLSRVLGASGCSETVISRDSACLIPIHSRLW